MPGMASRIWSSGQRVDQQESAALGCCCDGVALVPRFGVAQSNAQHLDEIEKQALELANTMQMRKAWTAQDLGVDVGWFMVRCAVRLWALRPEANQWRAFCGSATSSLGCGSSALCLTRRLDVATCSAPALQTFASSSWLTRVFAERARCFRSKLKKEIGVSKPGMTNGGPSCRRGVLPTVDVSWGATLGVEKAVEQNDDDVENLDDTAATIVPAVKAKIRRRMSYGFDLDMLVRAFDCLPCGNSTAEEMRMNKLIGNPIKNNLYAAMLRTLPDEAPGSDNDHAPAIRSERPIIERLASRLVAMPSDQAAKYWCPLLNKGPNATHSRLTWFHF